MDKIGFKSDLVSKLLGKSTEAQVKKPPGAVKVMGHGVSLVRKAQFRLDEPSLNVTVFNTWNFIQPYMMNLKGHEGSN